MEAVISYRPRIGKSKLEDLVKNKLHYKSVNQFIDHAVTRALQDDFGHHPLAKKISDMVYRVIVEQAELQFVKPSEAEAREIEEIALKTMSHKKAVPAKDVLKRAKKKK
ncbi:MAG TPA: hypothetical protein VK859_16590 [bacterium]|jgi:hypothetical protein|nr:hypothetical protein [bacterium]